jgi:hypothetical protein
VHQLTLALKELKMGLLDNIGNKLTSMSDDDKRSLALGLASGFAGMSGNPNTASIMAGIQNQKESLMKRRDVKDAQDLANDTLKRHTDMALQILGNKFPEISQLLTSGILTPQEAITESRKPPAERKMFKGADSFNYYADDLTRVLPDAVSESKTERKTAKDKFGILRYVDDGKPVFTPDPNATRVFDKDELGNINALRDDLGKELGQFNIIKQGYNNIITFFKDPNQVTDYAMAVSFAKVLDPGSVAREGEVKAVTNAGAKFPAYRAAFNNAIRGTGAMDPKMRYDIATAATSLYKERSVEATNSIEKYNALGVKAGIPKGNIYMGSAIVPAMSIPPWNMPQALASASIGMTQKQWSNLPYRKKVEFMESLKPGVK